MRLCQFVTCDATADLYYKGPWCARHAVETYGAVIGTLTRIESPSDGHARPPRRLGTGATPPPKGAPSSSGEGPDRAASVDGLSPPPALNVDDLLEILALDGWQEVEYELITRHGMTLHDLARRLHEVDAELSDV